MNNCYRHFFYWLFAVVLLLVASWWLNRQDYFALLFDADRSGISLVILWVFVIATLHAGWRQWVLVEYRLFFAQGKTQFLSLNHSVEHLFNQVSQDKNDDKALFQEVVKTEFSRGHQHGWFVADLMLKLGLLGTVVGFIFMLGSMEGLETIDPTSIQPLLLQMGDGMRLALFTTVAGLVAGALLGLQYQLLDAAAEETYLDALQYSKQMDQA